MRAIDLPKKLGEYDLIAPIDRGGMGEVWLASQKGPTKPCVVKILLPKFSRDPEYRRRFFREGEILAGLRHGRIVPVIDFGEDKGLLYLVMEFIDGVNLQTFFEALAHKGDRIPIVLVGYIIGEVLEALRHAHERIRDGYPRGVIHRDVKPSNVLITSEGEVLLTDFGIARYEAELSEEMFGTVAYMAPEQALGMATFQSDLFGASGLVHYMLTGEPPRRARNVVDLHETLSEPPPPTGRDDVPEPLERLRTLGLVPEVALRLESARAGLLLLERWDGYRKATTMTAEQYQRYVGSPHSGWTMLNRAAKVVEAKAEPDGPKSPSPSVDGSDPERPVKTERRPENETAERERSDQYVWKPWWIDGENDDDVCEDSATTRFVEPDAPRLFRRRTNPVATDLRGCVARTRAASVTQRLGPQSAVSADASAVPKTERLPPPDGAEEQRQRRSSTEPAAPVKPSQNAGTPRPTNELQPAEAEDAVRSSPRSPLFHGRAALGVAAATMLGALVVVAGMSLMTSESSAGSNDRVRQQPAGIPSLHEPGNGERKPRRRIPSVLRESPLPAVDSVTDKPDENVPASNEVADRPSTSPPAESAAAPAITQSGAFIEGTPMESEPNAAGEMLNAEQSTPTAGTPEPSPEPSPAHGEAGTDPKVVPTPTSKPPRVRVLLLVDGAMKGEVRIGQGTVRSFQNVVALKLRPGWYPLRWRERASDPWRKVESLRVAVEDPATQYLYVRISRVGTLIREVKTKPNTRRGR